MGWITLMLAGTFLTAGSSIVDKKVMNGQTVRPFICAASFGVVGLPAAILGIILLPISSWPQTLLGMVAGILFIPAAWLYYDTVTREDISRVVPMLRLTSLQIALLGVLFLGEMLTERQWVAFILLLLGSMLLSIEKRKGGITWSPALLRLLPVTTLLAINGILMTHVYRTTSIWTGIADENLGMVISVLAISLARRERISLLFRETSQQVWSVLIGEQLVRLLAEMTTASALVHGVPIALASTLNGAQLIWVWLLAILLLNERLGYKDLIFKFSGILGMSLGVYLLV